MNLNAVEMANVIAVILAFANCYLAFRFWIETRRSSIAWFFALAMVSLIIGRTNYVLEGRWIHYPGFEILLVLTPLFVNFFLMLFIVALIAGYRKEIHDVKASIALESIALGIAQVDLKGMVTYVNSAFGYMTGFSKEEIIGKPLTAIMPERFRERHQVAFQSYIAGGQKTLDWSNIKGRLRTVWKIEVPVTIALAEITDASGIKGFVGIFKQEKE